MHISVAVARFNEPITRRMLDLALARLHDLGVSPESTTVAWVPGSFELPVTARALALRPGADAVIALGAVIRGETAHFEHIANAASQGLARVSVETGKPVIFGVLTAYNAEQALARVPHAAGYAEAAIEMASLLRHLKAT
jgi:6,7-dimethyl-8-ribityllumazine synthase